MEHPASTIPPIQRPGHQHRGRRWAFHLTILVVLTAAFGTSFKAGSHGAYLLGFPPEFLFTAPLICDIVAGLATLVHGWARDDTEMHRWATYFVIGPMGLSWAANAIDHLGRAQPDLSWPALGQWAWIAAVIVFAGLCPASVAGLLFFSTKFREFEQRSAWSQDGSRPQPVDASVDNAATKSDDAATTLDNEPEFVEPVAIPQRVAVPAAEPETGETAPETEPAETLDAEFTELLKIEQLMAEERTRAGRPLARDIAEIMVRENVSRATAYRRRKERIDGPLGLG